jgi:hypothetical protein
MLMSIETAPKSDAHFAVNPANHPVVDPAITPTHNPAPIASTAASRRDDLGPVIIANQAQWSCHRRMRGGFIRPNLSLPALPM